MLSVPENDIFESKMENNSSEFDQKIFLGHEVILNLGLVSKSFAPFEEFLKMEMETSLLC